jgi:hypothetical protein
MRSSWSAQSGSCHVYYSVLWADLDCDPAELTVVMEPTRNAWAPVAAWFKRRSAKVVLCRAPSRRTCARTTPSTPRTTGWDSVVLTRLPLLHPEGLRALPMLVSARVESIIG